LTRYAKPEAEELAAAAARLGVPLEKASTLPPYLARDMADRAKVSGKSFALYMATLRAILHPVALPIKSQKALSIEELIRQLIELSPLGLTARATREKLGLSPKAFEGLRDAAKRRKLRIEFVRPTTITGRILQLAKAGYNAREISETIGYPLDHTYENISRFRKRGLLPPKEHQEHKPAHLFPSEAPALAARFSVPVELIETISDGDRRILRAYDPALTVEQLAAQVGTSYASMICRLNPLREKIGPLPLARKVERCLRCGQAGHRRKTCPEGA